MKNFLYALLIAITTTGTSFCFSYYTYSNNSEIISASYDSEAQAYFDAGSFSDEEKTAWNDWVVGIKEDFGISALTEYFDRIWPMLGNNEASALLDAVTAGNSMTNVNSATYAQGTGWTFNGSTNYLNTNYNPTDDGTNFTKDNASISIFQSRNANLSGLTLIGGQGATAGTQTHIFRNGNPGVVYRINGTPNSITGPNDQVYVAMYTASFRGTNDFEAYKNGVSVGTQTLSTSTNLTANDLYIGAINANETAANFSNAIITFAIVGKGLTDTEAADLYTRTAALNTALGR